MPTPVALSPVAPSVDPRAGTQDELRMRFTSGLRQHKKEELGRDLRPVLIF